MAPTAPHLTSVLLRPARCEDEADLVRLAALDSASPLPGPALVAEEDGAIVAALCLTTERAVANPFLPSQALVELLRRQATRRPPGADTSRQPRSQRIDPTNEEGR